MIADDDFLYTVEPNHREILSVSPKGSIIRLMDVSSSEGHVVPTSIRKKPQRFYLGNLGLFPVLPESAKVMALTEQRGNFGLAPGFGAEEDRVRSVDSRAGSTAVVSVKIGADGLLYAWNLPLLRDFRLRAQEKSCG